MPEDDAKQYFDARTTYNNPYQFQPVTLINSVASVALAAIATILTVALLDRHARNRQLHEALRKSLSPGQ